MIGRPISLSKPILVAGVHTWLWVWPGRHAASEFIANFAPQMMLTVTKIFRFEAAHVIYGYAGKCSRLHGHSYELHVTAGISAESNSYLAGTGMIIDFGDLKRLVTAKVLDRLDHKLIVSRAYLATKPGCFSNDELVVMEAEPTAENILLWLQREIAAVLPENVVLTHLRLYETKDSFAEWHHAKG
jgi:6-pyruvoyltetrahydropterin/6-carboxytetrahydropterin synthase